MLFTVLKYLFLSRDIQVFKICKSAKWWRHTLKQILIKYDQNRYPSQFLSEMFDSYSKILLNVVHNTSLTVSLPWQHTRFQTYPIFKAFLPPLAFHFHICKWCLICIIQQANKYVILGLWPRLTSFWTEKH